ncbi:MAG: tRNA dihydrouridine(20/20a) synthase DusA [Alphaproteobacteria bacterium]|nr:tRNA dihydrouridine(20/20a) synthase DusA [Alphaproteobacteria bacterium]
MAKTQAFSQKISVAPMLDWTDRHFRYFMRFITRRAALYTEMVAAPALVLGARDKLLQYNKAEHPVILQVGGADPKQMALCAQMAEEYGYDGINVNAGCPSSRVQSGQFGAVLMAKPELVAECVAVMRAACKIPVSVKTRIALESQTHGDGFDELLHFADLVRKAGCAHLIVHARKAKLNWSPKDNRARLPLDYNVVYRLKGSFPDMPISINGNIMTLDEAQHHLQYVDGAMLGRVAYGNPYLLAEVDGRFYADPHPILSHAEVLQKMLPYLHEHQEALTVILPHLMGLFHGTPVAKKYKQVLNSRDLETISVFALSADAEQASQFPLK